MPMFKGNEIFISKIRVDSTDDFAYQNLVKIFKL